MKKVIGVILLGILGHFASAQQQGQFSQYMLNPYIINPAAAGAQNNTEVISSFRGQWVGVDGAPINYYVSGQTILGRLYPEMRNRIRPKQAGGIIFKGQELGAFKRNGIYASYAYHLPVAKGTFVSVGLSAGMLNYQLNTNKVIFSNDNPDAAVQNVTNQNRFDANAGVFIYNKKGYIGLSVMQLLKSPLGFSTTFPDYGYLNNHLHLLAGYNIDLSDQFVLEPSVLIKSVAPVSYQIDVNAKVTFQNRFWAGVSYRKQDAIAFLAGLNVNDIFLVGYSYDFTTSGLRIDSKGTHEILVGVRIKKQVSLICPGDYW